MRKDLLRTDVNVYFDNLARVIARMPIQPIDQLVSVLLQAYESGRMIYLFGNGGSAALASHLACDLGKGTVNGSPKRFRALALTDSVPLMTAWANDSEYNNIFSEQLLNFVQPEDVAFAISGSGNSANVLNALEVARRAGAFTLGLTGFEGGQMKKLCDTCVVVPSDNMQIIEDLHLCVAHSLFTAIRQRLIKPESAAAAASQGAPAQRLAAIDSMPTGFVAPVGVRASSPSSGNFKL
jgi:D-sedoheptulose 7-phosphate isomerase